ncbi:MAG: ribosome silencing factor [Flavobacteriales bacterium]|nr:ribosome silencing factor [Flavobacteriales bacterium]
MKKKNESKKLTEAIVHGMLERKAKDIVLLDMTGIENAFCEYFVICHGDSNTQVDAIADSVVEEVRKAVGEKPWSKEGYENAEWILLDYGNVVAHIFQPTQREFYRIEELWADARREDIREEAVGKKSVKSNA